MTSNVDPEHFDATLEDPVGAAVELKRPFMAVAVDEDVVRCIDVVQHMTRLLAVSRRRDWTKLLNLLSKMSEKMRRVGGIHRRADEVAWDRERFAEDEFR